MIMGVYPKLSFLAKEMPIWFWSLFLMASLFSLTSETLSFLVMMHIVFEVFVLSWFALKINYNFLFQSEVLIV